MSSCESKKHFKDALVHKLILLLETVLKLCDDIQRLVTTGARAASGAVAFAMGATVSAVASFFSDSKSAVRSLLSRVEGVTEESRDLRQRLRNRSDRIAGTERRIISLPNAGRGKMNLSLYGKPLSQASKENSEYQSRNDNSRSLHTGPTNKTQTEFVRRLVNLEHRVADHEVLLGENGRNVEDARHQNSYLQRQMELVQETIRRLERRVESQDHMMALRNFALADLEEYIRQQEVSSYDGVLLWKITDFTRRRNDAQGGRQTSFYSPSFYTSRHGYKMCARIYLNGDGMWKGAGISLCFVVMRGQYDALLRWPFRQKVTLMILDQDNIEHVINAFRPDPSSSSFQRPQREMNIASGCPLFFPLTELEKHAYVRDDTMFLKIIVDTSDL